VYDPFLAPIPQCLPGEPTDAAPGSERKIRVLIERAARHEPLFHPLDGRRKNPRPFWTERVEEEWREEPPVPGTPLTLPAEPVVQAIALGPHSERSRTGGEPVWEEAG
jgi:hypothetical protein